MPTKAKVLHVTFCNYTPYLKNTEEASWGEMLLHFYLVKIFALTLHFFEVSAFKFSIIIVRPFRYRRIFLFAIIYPHSPVCHHLPPLPPTPQIYHETAISSISLQIVLHLRMCPRWALLLASTEVGRCLVLLTA